MKKITLFALCVLSVGMCAAQLNGGGNVVHTVNNDNPNAGTPALLTGRGLLPSYKFLGQLYGINTIHNGYGNRGYGRSDLSPIIYNLDRSLDMRWRRARLFLNGIPNDISARYNPLFDDIEIKDKDKIYRLVKRNDAQITFLDTDETYIAKSYTDNLGQEVVNYFFFDENQKNTGILKKEVYAYTGSKTSRYNHNTSARKPLKLEKKEEFYMIRDNKLVALSAKRKAIKQDFPEHSKLILAFVKEHKIKKDTPENLKALASYIKSLEINIYDETLVASN